MSRRQTKVTEEPELVEPVARKNSKEKGGKFELKIAKIFEAWTGETFRRTPGSGGWSKDPGFNVAGDLVCVNAKFPFSVECKKRETSELSDLITGLRRNGWASICEWWHQTCRDAESLQKKPLLVFSKNKAAVLVMIRSADLLARSVGDTIVGPWMFPYFEITLTRPHHGWADKVTILSLQNFTDYMRPPKGMKNRKSWKRKEIPR